MRKWLIVLMAAVAIGATGILGWLYMRQDRKGPEITIAESKKNSYTSDMTTEDLLEGVKAVDKRDGDVSASLTVENVYPNEKGDEVTVVYVAKDNSNNVTKVTYHMTSEGNLMGFTSETKTSSDNTDTDAETDEALQDENETDSEDEEEPEMTEEEKVADAAKVKEICEALNIQYDENTVLGQLFETLTDEQFDQLVDLGIIQVMEATPIEIEAIPAETEAKLIEMQAIPTTFIAIQK